jgi:hypothetical protein
MSLKNLMIEAIESSNIDLDIFVKILAQLKEENIKRGNLLNTGKSEKFKL